MHKPKSAIAVVVASVVLTLGIGGGSFALGKITGADIKDGTVTSADIKNQTLKLKDLAPATVKGLSQGPRVIISGKGPGSYLPEPPADTTFHSMTVPKGTWLVSVTATVFPHDFSSLVTPDAQCHLKTADSSSLLARVGFTEDDGYVNLATQMTVDVSSAISVGLVCNGANFGVNNVTITAIEAGSVTDVSP
jgi:hypothetical protein